ncbi:hypothetical protein JCM11641_003761 [Rhodosporidiobolus odoratus]
MSSHNPSKAGAEARTASRPFDDMAGGVASGAAANGGAKVGSAQSTTAASTGNQQRAKEPKEGEPNASSGGVKTQSAQQSDVELDAAVQELNDLLPRLPDDDRAKLRRWLNDVNGCAANEQHRQLQEVLDDRNTATSLEAFESDPQNFQNCLGRPGQVEALLKSLLEPAGRPCSDRPAQYPSYGVMNLLQQRVGQPQSIMTKLHQDTKAGVRVIKFIQTPCLTETFITDTMCRYGPEFKKGLRLFLGASIKQAQPVAALLQAAMHQARDLGGLIFPLFLSEHEVITDGLIVRRALGALIMPTDGLFALWLRRPDPRDMFDEAEYRREYAAERARKAAQADQDRQDRVGKKKNPRTAIQLRRERMGFASAASSDEGIQAAAAAADVGPADAVRSLSEGEKEEGRRTAQELQDYHDSILADNPQSHEALTEVKDRKAAIRKFVKDAIPITALPPARHKPARPKPYASRIPHVQTRYRIDAIERILRERNAEEWVDEEQVQGDIDAGILGGDGQESDVKMSHVEDGQPDFSGGRNGTMSLEGKVSAAGGGVSEDEGASAVQQEMQSLAKHARGNDGEEEHVVSERQVEKTAVGAAARKNDDAPSSATPRPAQISSSGNNRPPSLSSAASTSKEAATGSTALSPPSVSKLSKAQSQRKLKPQAPAPVPSNGKAAAPAKGGRKKLKGENGRGSPKKGFSADDDDFILEPRAQTPSRSYAWIAEKLGRVGKAPDIVVKNRHKLILSGKIQRRHYTAADDKRSSRAGPRECRG